MVSCNDNGPNGQKPDDEVSGKIKISVDESLKPFADSEVKTFLRFYKRASIIPSYKPEAASIADMLKDSSRMIIIPRRLTDAEQKIYTDKKRNVRMIKIAYDAVALIVNNNNPDTTLTTARLGDIMHGKINNWKQIGGKNGKMQVVFDNIGSSALDYLKKRFNMTDSLPADFYALHSDEEVINYVEKTPEALGFIGVNWITAQDSVPNSFTKKIKVVALNPPDTAKGADQPYYLPYQAYISLGYYPLIREVYGITPEFYNGLGTGFINFMASEKGQTLVRLSGLLPATMPVRFVHIKKDFK
jgi:phosphate transport system substrate-binding protein